MQIQKIRVNSYIISSKNYRAPKPGVEDEEFFIDIKNWEQLEPRKLDPNRVFGAITLIINGMALTDLTYWDEVDCLWHYFIMAFAEFERTGKSSFSFPNQPLPVALTTKNEHYVRVSIEDKSVSVNKVEFMEAMYKNALDLFETLQKLFPRLTHNHDHIIGEINKQRKQLHEQF